MPSASLSVCFDSSSAFHKVTSNLAPGTCRARLSLLGCARCIDVGRSRAGVARARTGPGVDGGRRWARASMRAVRSKGGGHACGCVSGWRCFSKMFRLLKGGKGAAAAGTAAAREPAAPRTPPIARLRRAPRSTALQKKSCDSTADRRAAQLGWAGPARPKGPAACRLRPTRRRACGQDGRRRASGAGATDRIRRRAPASQNDRRARPRRRAAPTRLL
jgi:hypothetical protein